MSVITPEQKRVNPEIPAMHWKIAPNVSVNWTKIIYAICVLGAARVLFFCVVFPVFNPTDEGDQLDVVHKYARGFRPGIDSPEFDRQSMEYIYWYQTWEYFISSDVIKARHLDVPLWQVTPDQSPQIEAAVEKNSHNVNSEAVSPPVYYAIAAVWYRFGELLHLQGLSLLYWLRFLNPLAYFLFLLLSYRFVSAFYTENHFLRIAVPLVLAFFPQDVFYGINREVLTPPFFLLALFLLLRINSEKSSSYRSCFICGLAVSLAVLVDYPNIILFGVLLFVVLAKLRKPSGSGNLQQYAGIAVMLASATLPMAALMLRNFLVMADPTGGRLRAAALGWSIKPLKQMFHHPIFTTDGLIYFLGRVMETFWRGEYSWHLNQLSFESLDLFYQISSLLLILAFITHLFRTRKLNSPEQFCNRMCLFVFFSSLLFLAVLSLPWDFGNCFYPSRELPYFASGRIICGTLVPFVVMYLTGLQTLISRLRIRISPLAITILLVGLMFTSEIAYSRDVFKSAFNLPNYIKTRYHL